MRERRHTPPDERRHASDEALAPRRFVVLRETPCPYLPDRYERKMVTDLAGPDADSVYGELSRGGFRRSHRFAYRPACTGCSACIPARIVATAYTRSKSQRRVARKNADLAVEITAPLATQEQFALFSRYIRNRHGDGDMATMTYRDYAPLVEDSAVTTRVAEFRRRDCSLAAVCVLDVLDDGLSAVYSFFDPAEPRRSLGTFVIDWLAHAAAAAYGRNLYLGYWIPQAPKMAYKRRFQPLEVLVGGTWRRLSPDAPAPRGSRPDA